MGFSTSGEFTNAERTKLTNIEALADVTDSVNVDAANAVMDADFSGAIGFMEKASAGVYDLITSQELNADIIDLIRPLHPNVSMLAAIDETTESTIRKVGNVYKLGGTYWIDTSTYNSSDTYWVLVATKTVTDDITEVEISCELGFPNANAGTVYGGYTLNGGDYETIITKIFGAGDSNFYKGTVACSNLSTNDIIRFYIASANPYPNEGRIKNCEIISAEPHITGNVLTDAIAASAAVLSFFSHLKGKFINGVGNTHATPIQVEIFGNGDSYAAALNGTTKFKIAVADPRIELYRTDNSVVAKSNTQENWTMDDNGSTGAFPSKTTSTHETILAEEIGCASVVMVEKSVNGSFTDTEILVEDDDYTVDYSTRTATKIILTSAEAADIVISQSKLRITWIADVEDIEGTANTALKMKIYLNRTSTSEASPEIQKIDIGTDKYAEMQYLCG